MRRAFEILASCLILIASGCAIHHHEAYSPLHEHGRSCRHVLVEGIWVLLPPEHTHRQGCGHFLKGGVWHGYKAVRGHKDGLYFR